MRSNKQGEPTWQGIQVLLVVDDFCLGNCCHAWLNHDDCNHSDSCHGDCSHGDCCQGDCYYHGTTK